MQKLINALSKTKIQKDTVPVERLEIEMVRETIFTQCEQYLENADQILEIEILPSILDAGIACLNTEKFLEKYEFQQNSENTFLIKMRAYNIL